MPKGQSKESRIIAIMNLAVEARAGSGTEPSMADVCATIAEEFGFPVSRARAYYSTMVRTGRALGKLESAVPTRAPKAPKPKGSKGMLADAENAMRGAPAPGMDLKALQHEEVIARLLNRGAVDAGEVDDEAVAEALA